MAKPMLSHRLYTSIIFSVPPLVPAASSIPFLPLFSVGYQNPFLHINQYPELLPACNVLNRFPLFAHYQLQIPSAICFSTGASGCYSHYPVSAVFTHCMQKYQLCIKYRSIRNVSQQFMCFLIIPYLIHHQLSALIAGQNFLMIQWQPYLLSSGSL